MIKIKKKTALDWKHIFDSEEFAKTYHYSKTDLGANYSRDHTEFKIWAPVAEEIVINLFRTGSVEDSTIPYREEICMEKQKQGVWFARLEGDYEGVYYTYSIKIDGIVSETQDPYTKACGVNGRRSMIVNLKHTNPKNWNQDNYHYDNKKQPVIYEVHMKDFSSSKSSGIPSRYRGRYKAFTVSDSTLNNDGKNPTCLAYLKKLGITHVHLLPCFDFGSMDESKALEDQFNWGYDPVNYNVPEGIYATNPYDGDVRIKEFKEMVLALHEAGIGVILDVVYNHTYSTDSCFQRTVPYYYYRINKNGEFSNGSICGNDTSSERYMFRKYMIESVCYWAKEYHIDGFRFDLMGLHDIETMNEIRKALNELDNGKNIMMYGEPWRGDKSAMKSDAIPALKKNVSKLDEGIAIFSDDTRDCIKGSVFFKEKPGFVNGKKNLESKVKSSICAWCGENSGYTPHNPGQIISYVSAHDNFTLWDKLNYTIKEVPEFNKLDPEIIQANKFAAGIVMTSLGGVFFQAGEEFGRTKQGIGDSYASSSSINELDWERAYKLEKLVRYYQGLIHLRKEFNAFLNKDKNTIVNITFFRDTKGIVAFEFHGFLDSNQKWSRLLILHNANKKKKQINVPAGEWKMISDGTKIFDEPLTIGNIGNLIANPIATMIYGEENINYEKLRNL